MQFAGRWFILSVWMYKLVRNPILKDNLIYLLLKFPDLYSECEETKRVCDPKLFLNLSVALFSHSC